MIKGIDVAKWQGNIDWKVVKKDEIQFAILKIIDKSNRTESAFEKNYQGAILQNIPIGVYNYSYATTVKKAILDAKSLLKSLNERKVQCKVWLDVEDGCQKNLGRTLPDIINAYKNIIESAGYEFGVYTGLSFYNSYIKPYANMISCPFWIARYPSNARMELSKNPSENKKPTISHPLWGWQYSSKGYIPGIAGNVDLNIMYAKMDDDAGTSMPRNPYQEPTYILYRYKPMSKEHVKWLQYELNEMGYQLAVDGIFGKATDLALRSAQKKFNILVDGKCGNDTKYNLKIN